VIYKFDQYTLDMQRRELRRELNLVTVEPQVLDLLHYLICKRDRVVSKDDLIAEVWKGRIVSESTLSSRITAVRHAIGDSGDHQRLIRTIVRKGFRFIGDVREDSGHSGGVAQAMPYGSYASIFTTEMSVAGLPDKPSIAVLPFTNMSGDPEQEYFSDGITEDIISALSRLRWFFVIARNSTFAYKGHAVNVINVGRDLGVRYVLEGSIRKSGQRIRFTSQLLDAISGHHIWSERYDRELTDIFALQDEITASVAAAIEPKLLAAEGTRAETRSVEDLDAWDIVARALSHLWKLNSAGGRTAINMLDEAVRRHPNYGSAHSMQAFALLVSGHMGWVPSEVDRALATRLAHRAIELDDGDPWAHMALGYLAFTERETDEAVRHFRAALDLNPNFAAAHGYVGFALAFDGRSGEALRHFEQAIRMSPRDPLNGFFLTGYSVAHYLAGRYQEAIQWGRQAVQLRPGFLGGHRILCASLGQAGRLEEARAAMNTLLELQPSLSIEWIKRSVPYMPAPMTHFLEGMRKAGLDR
jgi:TolB-like protein